MEIYTDVDDCNGRIESQTCPEFVAEVIAFSGIDGALNAALGERPAVMFRHLATPSNETERFLEIATCLERSPLLMTYTDDLFTPAQNPYKRRLGKLRVEGRAGSYTNVSVIAFGESVNSRQPCPTTLAAISGR